MKKVIFRSALILHERGEAREFKDAHNKSAFNRAAVRKMRIEARLAGAEERGRQTQRQSLAQDSTASEEGFGFR